MLDSFKKEMVRIKCEYDFFNFVSDVENQPGYKKPMVFAVGVATIENGKTLEAYYPLINLNENHGTAAILSAISGHLSGSDSIVLNNTDIQLIHGVFEPFRKDGHLPHPNVNIFNIFLNQHSFNDCRKRIVVTFIEDFNKPPVSTEEAYLRLQMISHRKVKPNSINLDGLFNLLPNVAWTNKGPMTPERANEEILKARLAGNYLQVFSVDKFPRMTDYIVPSEVRIADAIRIRLGAHLGKGATC